jgi:site-specific DNA recombinase
MDRLLTAYQEDLLSLDELRRRMPELRQRERALQAELQSILDQVNDRAVYLRLAETLSGFLVPHVIDDAGNFRIDGSAPQ